MYVRETKLKDVLMLQPPQTIFLVKAVLLVQFAPTETIRMQPHTMLGNIFHLLNTVFKYLLFPSSLFSTVFQCCK